MVEEELVSEAVSTGEVYNIYGYKYPYYAIAESIRNLMHKPPPAFVIANEVTTY